MNSFLSRCAFLSLIGVLSTSGMLSCATAQPSSSKKKVALHFRWAPGTQLQVERLLQVAERPELDVKHFFSWHVERHSDGIVLLPRTSHAQGAQPLAHYMQLRSMPTVVVDAWGQYVGFEDVEAEKKKMKRSMLSSFALLPSRPETVDMSAGIPFAKQPLFDDELARLWWSLLAGASAERVFRIGEAKHSNIRVGEKEWARQVTLLSEQSCPKKVVASSDEPNAHPKKNADNCVWLEIRIRRLSRAGEEQAMFAGECDAKILTRMSDLSPVEMAFSRLLEEKSVEHRLLFGPLLPSVENAKEETPTLITERWRFQKVAMKAVALPMGEADEAQEEPSR
ncbi:MAG: hypothetical protein GY822_03125 [Deltaproteobacteria bacterium]|nr:hypothetical protein [Deltaproteobacteria bacterium]